MTEMSLQDDEWVSTSFPFHRNIKTCKELANIFLNFLVFEDNLEKIDIQGTVTNEKNYNTKSSIYKCILSFNFQNLSGKNNR